MFFASTILTFALPYGAFIAAAIGLFFLFRARHSGPRLKWSAATDVTVASVTTWEPGPAPAPSVAQIDLASELASAAAAVPGQADTTPADTTPADPAEGKDGEGE